MMKLIATTLPGLEPIAAQDLREQFGVQAEPDPPGAVTIALESNDLRGLAGPIRALNRWARGVGRVGLLLAAGQADSLDGIYGWASEVDYEALLEADQPFAVRPLRRGDHAFGSPDIGRVVGQAVIDRYRRSTGARLPVSLDNPEVIFRAELVGDGLRIWLDATGDTPLNRRGYRKHHHPAALDSRLAYLMLRLADWRGGPLIDPMCGVATIPIEAALYERGIAPGKFRSTWAHERLRWIGSDDGAEPVAGDQGMHAALVPEAEPLRILGVERFVRHVQGARLNVVAAGLTGELEIAQGDATDLGPILDRWRRQSEVPSESTADESPIVVVNPPFGRRIGSAGIVEELYRGFCRSAAAVGVARIVTLTERLRAMRAALENAGYEITDELRILYGALEAVVLVGDRD